MRKNTKNNVISYENSIKKSNELSMAKMNQGLSLNQMQLFAYAIFSTQQDGRTEFRKHEFEKKFNIDQLRPNDAMDDAYRLLDLKIQMRDADNEKGRGHNVFTDYFYDRGQFSFNWNESFLPHILELKEKYIMTDLNIASQFKSGFTWILYDYLKAHYGYWHKVETKEELLKLFSVENVKSYQKNTSIFKNKVLDVAITELNKYTELEVWYKEIKKGRAIVGFKLQWSSGKQVAGATEKQLILLREVYDQIQSNMFEYLAIRDFETARSYIIEVNDIHLLAKKGLSVNQADEFIKKTLEYYRLLEKMVERDGKKRDISIYYNWLEYC